jgi:hypothetical protein
MREENLIHSFGLTHVIVRIRFEWHINVYELLGDKNKKNETPTRSGK